MEYFNNLFDDVIELRNSFVRCCRCCENEITDTDYFYYGRHLVCNNCLLSVDIEALMKRVFDTPCKCVLLFPESAGAVVDRELCDECDSYHIQDARLLGDSDMLKRCLDLDQNSMEEDALYLHNMFLDELIVAIEEVKESWDKSRAMKTDLEDARRRLLKRHVPVLGRLSDEEFDKHVGAKFARIQHFRDLKRVEQLLKPDEEMSQEEVIAFARFLSQ